MLALAGAALLLTSAAMVAPARGQSAALDQAGSSQARAAYDDRTLRSFAQAAATVLTLRSNYYPRVRAAEIAGSQEKADRLFGEMRQMMRRAIGEAGFSEEQYRAIADAAKADPGLHQRITDLLQGPPPALQHLENVTPAPSATAAPAPAKALPTTPPPPAADQQQLTHELDQAIGERDRYRAEQQALRDKVAALEQQLASVKEQDSAQRTQLVAEKEQAQAEQKQTEQKLSRLHGEVAGLKDQLASAQSRDADLREQLDAERARAEEARRSKEAKLAAFQSEIERLVGRLAKARRALDALADNLSPTAPAPATPAAPPFQALTPLQREPTSIERVMANANPQFALRQQLNDEIARAQKEREHREAERAALQGEIADLSRELAATYQAMAELIGQPTDRAITVANLDQDDETDAPLDLSDATAQLFPAAPAGHEQAHLDAAAGILLQDASIMDSGDPLLEPGPAKPADSADLDAHDFTALRINPAPAVEIATVPTPPAAAPVASLEPAPDSAAASPRAAHQIARGDDQAALGAPSPRYSASVRGGADAYRAGDYRDAFEIWAALAESGSRSAQFHLGALYFEGRGTRADIALSHFWLQVSAFQGDERAAALLSVVADKLTHSQIDASRRQAREWLQQHAREVTQAG